MPMCTDDTKDWKLAKYQVRKLDFVIVRFWQLKNLVLNMLTDGGLMKSLTIEQPSSLTVFS